MVNPSFLKPDMSDIHSSSLYKKVEESKKYEPESPE